MTHEYMVVNSKQAKLREQRKGATAEAIASGTRMLYIVQTNELSVNLFMQLVRRYTSLRLSHWSSINNC
jgi:hypothetical protein